MRNPARKALYHLLALVAGSALIWFGILREQRIGEDWSSIGPAFLGLSVAPFALVFLIQALFATRGQARLRAGHREIARWHVYPGEWEQFRKLDARRAAEDSSLVNDLWIRKAIPSQGIEVIAGETSLLVDGSYHVLRPGGLPEVREVRWLDGPPTCLEFALVYPRSRYGGTVPTTLRVPVPSGSRGAAQRVVDHFRPRLIRKPALALRNPPRTYRICAWLLAAAAAMAATGYAWARGLPDGSSPLVPLALLIAGLGLATFAAILAAAVWLVTRPG
ncbi:MAG: hypothetical protein QOG72_1370 [Sphingomonadales bacterium]|jgi:hypothetical protein|nr:hypothetical protein [Sphingomonadales bacterium]